MPLMTASPSGVTVRMYRQGHGDCFLLAFPSGEERPSYVLIDCGYKPGSKVHADITTIAEHIGESTGNFIDTVIITHEHQDHVNGIWKKGAPYFRDIGIGETWLAWTEDPKDRVAEALRKRHKDQLLGLVAARDRLAAAGDSETLNRIDDLLSLEVGEDEASSFAAAAKDPSKSVNKQALKLVKDKATAGVRYIRPHGEIMSLRRVAGVRVFALGPPRREDLLMDEDPRGSEAFPGHGFKVMARASFFAAAQATALQLPNLQPFAGRVGIPRTEALKKPSGDEKPSFFLLHYGAEGSAPEPVPPDAGDDEVPQDAEFRRIDTEWLRSAEDLALALNRGINNTSLVLAFELPATRKVLLFVGDAQRGNWLSWTSGQWTDGDTTITARDLLARTVLYKVGHHGSHNATLDGTPNDEYPNLSWMGQGAHGLEFAAMITAVPKWAYAQTPEWAHPLESIKAALMEKASGRVFQTDTDVIRKPDTVSDAEWRVFQRRTRIDDLYFEYDVLD